MTMNEKPGLSLVPRGMVKALTHQSLEAGAQTKKDSTEAEPCGPGGPVGTWAEPPGDQVRCRESVLLGSIAEAWEPLAEKWVGRNSQPSMPEWSRANTAALVGGRTSALLLQLDQTSDCLHFSTSPLGVQITEPNCRLSPGVKC